MELQLFVLLHRLHAGHGKNLALAHCATYILTHLTTLFQTQKFQRFRFRAVLSLNDTYVNTKVNRKCRPRNMLVQLSTPTPTPSAAIDIVSR